MNTLRIKKKKMGKINGEGMGNFFFFFFFFGWVGKKIYQKTDLSYEAFFLKTKSVNLEKYITFLIYYSLYTQKIMFLVYKSVRVFFLKCLFQ